MGNKIDLRGGEVTNEALEEEIGPIMAEFKVHPIRTQYLEPYLTTFHPGSRDLRRMFRQNPRQRLRSLLLRSKGRPTPHRTSLRLPRTRAYPSTNPTRRLAADIQWQCLKPACVDALKRIFKLCDVNKDGVLDATELNEFQRKCFDAPLQLQELEGIRHTVRSNIANGLSAVSTTKVPASNSATSSPSDSPSDEGLTEAGFLYLHTMFIQRGRLETTWTVLRKFGYAEDLRLKESFLEPKCVRFLL